VSVSKLAGLVLAGGSASRMGGGDKPLLDVGGRSMLERVIATLVAETSAIAISASADPSRFARFGIPILPDGPFVGRGPLAGVLAGLDWAAMIGAESLLTVPGDTPFIPSGLAAALAPPPSHAVSHGRAHFLVALWPVAARQPLRALLETHGSTSALCFVNAICMRPVTFSDLHGDPFLNVNTPDDLATARAIAEGSL
jgi:molybdopterin-guanine dinucleotide biosynthesis protein A